MSMPPDTYICPVTKLPILNKPEWNKVGFGNDYKISAEIIDEQIFVTHNYGTPTLHDVQNAMHFTTHIIDNFLDDRPYIHIFDYSGIKQRVSLEARRFAIKELKGRKQMLAAIFYGLSPSLKLSIKIARFFHQLPFTCLITQDYTEAMESALTILNDSEKNPLIVGKKKALDCETARLIENISQKKPSSDNTDPDPFDCAVELIEDEIQYLEERESETRRQNTLARLDKIISNRNEKARIYWNSLRPRLKVQNKPDK